MSPSRRAASRMPGCKGVALHWDIGALAHWLLWGVGATLRDVGALGGALGQYRALMRRWGTDFWSNSGIGASGHWYV